MQPVPLELLAPARNLDIGIAAIDCGADAVYIAGPAFGARQAAGNSVADIRTLCTYAHRFGARIFVTVNTVLFENELEEARALVRSIADAGADALIVQDLALTELCRGLGLPLHASTQCAIRTPERAAFLAGLGFSRLVPERQLSLDEIRAIHAAVPECEIECFVHGALCVCYSGQCYLSEYIDGRSANRGACIQACRSRYDLVDERGKVLVRDKALLSLKDFNLIHRLGDLAGAGACSFKIEGRLKSISYVRNVVRAYSMALDELVRTHPDRYRRASFGTVTEGFAPDLQKTFQRGYTALYLDGKRERGWSSADAPKSIGEKVGRITAIRPDRRSGMLLTVQADKGVRLENGDGFALVAGGGRIIGFRADSCHIDTISAMGQAIETPGDYRFEAMYGPFPTEWKIRAPRVEGIFCGTLYRNLSMAFERGMDRQPCKRQLRVSLSLTFRPGTLHVTARCEDGRTAEADFSTFGSPVADNPARMREIIAGQLSKTVGHYAFGLSSVVPDAPGDSLPLLKSAFLNDIRRRMADALEGASVTDSFASLGMTGGSSQEKTDTKEDSTVRQVPEDEGKAAMVSGGVSTPGHGQGEGPVGYELLRSNDEVDNGRGRSELCERSSPDTIALSRKPEAARGYEDSYKENVANSVSRKVLQECGAARTAPAYELSHEKGAELMRSRYCIRYELGMCPRYQGARDRGPLFLLNNGRRLALGFDCARCEMTVLEG